MLDVQPRSGPYFVAELAPGVVQKNVVQRRALHGDAFHGDASLARGLHKGAHRVRTAVRGDVRYSVALRYANHLRQGLQRLLPMGRLMGKLRLHHVVAGNAVLQLRRRIQCRSLPWSTIAMRSQSLSASSL